MPPTRYLCLTAHKSNSSSLRQSLTLGLTCLVSIGGGHQTVLSLPAENKRPADDSQRDVDVHQSKRPFRDSSPTNLPGTSHSQPESCEVDPSQWVELLSMGWTLDDAELIARESEISADTQKLWRAFHDLVHELTFPEPCHEGVRASFNKFNEHVRRFFRNPRSYLEDRIFFSMAEPLMSLSQHIEEWELVRLQRYFKSHRREALLKWLSTRNESQALIPGIRLSCLMMEDIAEHIKFWGRQDRPEYNEGDPIESCFVKLLHGIEDVDLYKECIAHIEAAPDLDIPSTLKLLVIVPYFTKSKVAKDVSPSSALSYLSRWVRHHPISTEQDFVNKGWTLNNFHFVGKRPSFRERQMTGERQVEEKFFDIVNLLRDRRSFPEAKRHSFTRLLDKETLAWMNLVESSFAPNPSYRALRSVVGMLPSLVDAERSMSQAVRKQFQKFAMKQRARTLANWLGLADDAKLLVDGERLSLTTRAALCQTIMTHTEKNCPEDHALRTILRSEENGITAEIERYRVERCCSARLREQSHDDLAVMIVSQLFYKHAGLTSVSERTLERCLEEFTGRRASSFERFVRRSGIDKANEPGCIAAAQRAFHTGSSSICDVIIKETVEAFRKSWATHETTSDAKAAIEHIQLHCEEFSRAELFSALTCLLCIKHRFRASPFEGIAAECINLCEERLKLSRTRRDTLLLEAIQK